MASSQHEPASERQLLWAMLAAPDDPVKRRALADWYTGRGDPRGELVMLAGLLFGPEVPDGAAALRDRFSELATTVDRPWLELITRARLHNCGQAAGLAPRQRFVYRCPLVWEQLTPTAQASDRHCASCDRTVHRCSSIEEAERHARRGDCISIDRSVEQAVAARETEDMTGRPDWRALWAETVFGKR